MENMFIKDKFSIGEGGNVHSILKLLHRTSI